MSTIIDSLEIQIESSSGNAAKSIDLLADKLGKLRENTKLTTVINNLTKLKTSIDSLKTSVSGFEDFERFAKSMESLAGIHRMTGLNSALNSLKKLPDVVSGLSKVDMDSFSDSVTRVTTILAPLATQIDSIGRGFSNLPQSIRSVITATQNYTNATRQASAADNTHSAALNVRRINLSALITTLKSYLDFMHKIAMGIKDVTAEAIEWDGIQYRFGRAFGDDAQVMLAHIDRVSKALYINKQEFMQYSGLYGSLLKGFGLEQEKVTQISRGLTEMTYDIWAANNDRYKRLEDAANAVRSAITGEIEPIRNAGIALSEASLKEYLADIGMAGVKMSELNEASKAQLRYAVMVKSAMQQGIMGTYAHETMTAEGAVRSLSQQLKSLAQAFGTLLLPILSAVIPVITAFVSVLYDAVAALASFFGITLYKIDWGGASSGLTGIGDEADSANDALSGASNSAKELKNALMAFDELNIIPSDSSGKTGSGSGGGGGGFLDLELPDYNFLQGQVENQIRKIKKKLQPFLDWLKDHLFDILAVAGEIGMAMALWNVSNGLLSSLGVAKSKLDLLKAGLGMMATAVVTATVSYSLTNDYLETGDYSNLVVDGITTALGAAISGGVAYNAGLGKTGAIFTAATTVALSATTSILAIYKDASMGNGFDEETLIASIWAAMKDAIAGGMIASAAGVSIELGVAVGGGIALLGIGLALGIGAIKFNEIQESAWGDVTLTKDQITKYVEDNLFTIDVEAKISQIEITQESKDEAIESLKTQLNEFDSALTLLKLGVDDSETYSAMLKSLTGGAEDGTYTSESILGQLEATLGAYNSVIRLGVGTFFSDANGGEANAQSLVETMGLTSDLVQTTANEIGRELSGYLAEGMTGGLDEKKAKMVQDLSNWLNEINMAAIEGQISGDFMTRTKIAVSDMTQETASAVVSQFDTMQAELRKSYEELAISQVSSMQGLAAAAEATYRYNLERYGENADSTVEAYTQWQSMKAEVDSFTAGMETYINDAVARAISPAREILMSGFQEMFSDSFVFDLSGKDFFATTFSSEIADAISEGDYKEAAKYFQEAINQSIAFSMSNEDYEVLKEASEALGLTLFDFLSEDTKSNLREFLGTAFDAQQVNNLFAAIGSKTTEETANGMGANNEAVTNAAQSLVDSTSGVLKSHSWFGDGFSIVAEFANGVKTAATVAKVGSTITNIVGRLAKPRRFATGGYPESGELFVANEAGAEMVGRIGNRTAVANNDQIVSGIASGVASANSEQNALLREQNALLRQLLQKEVKAELVPSAALGRVNARAAALYEKAYG